MSLEENVDKVVADVRELWQLRERVEKDEAALARQQTELETHQSELDELKQAVNDLQAAHNKPA